MDYSKIPKKKSFKMLQPVRDFMDDQSVDCNRELDNIIRRLEIQGMLEMPYGEKITGKNLFVIRVMHTKNIRVFYVYGRNDLIYGIHAYKKSTKKIPDQELEQACRVLKLLKQSGKIK